MLVVYTRKKVKVANSVVPPYDNIAAAIIAFFPHLP
jgi:hypothetical protein